MTAQEEASASADPAQAPAKNIFAYPGYVKLLAASLLGALGDRFYQGLMIATANAIFIKSTATRQATRVQTLSILPMLILYGFVGSLVDSCDRRRLLAWLEGIKVVVVLGFVWLLYNFNTPGQITPSESVPPEWNYGLWLVILLNIITVPFSPARASVVPDVLPEERQSMGASLIATAGLCSYLIGSFAGLNLARTSSLGPVIMTLVTSGLFAISSIVFRMLPQNVTVPNNRKKGAGDGAPPKKMTLAEYFAEQLGGFTYCVKHPSLLALIFFETVFWTIASMVLVLLLFYASYVLGMEGDPKTSFFATGLSIAGIGIVGGALGAGKTARGVSPIFTYTPAMLLIGVGFLYAFGSAPVSVVVNGVATNTAHWSFYPMLFAMALGGGMMLGRVDADVLAIADERYRGRIFALKAVAFGICTLAATYYLSEQLTDAQMVQLIHVLPRVLLWLVPAVFVLAWMVDVAIWAHRTDIPAPTFRKRMQFKFCRFWLWCWLKIHVRYSTEGAEKIPRDGKVIIAGNHGSFLDPIFMGCGVPRMVQYMMYTSYYTSFMHPLFRFLATIPVDEKKHLAALRAGVNSLEKGACIGIFPEGQVATGRFMNSPMGGALFLAQKSGAQVVPAAIKGNWDAFPRGAWFPRFKKVTVVFGEPFTVGKDLSKEEAAAKMDQMMAWIAGQVGVPPPKK